VHALKRGHSQFQEIENVPISNPALPDAELEQDVAHVRLHHPVGDAQRRDESRAAAAEVARLATAIVAEVALHRVRSPLNRIDGQGRTPHGLVCFVEETARRLPVALAPATWAAQR